MTTARPEFANGEPAPVAVTGLPVLYSAEAIAQALGLLSANWLEEQVRQKGIPHTKVCLAATPNDWRRERNTISRLCQKKAAVCA